MLNILALVFIIVGAWDVYVHNSMLNTLYILAVVSFCYLFIAISARATK